jgi:hypothetical protein
MSDTNKDQSLKFGSILYECTKQGFAIDFPSSLGLNLFLMGFTPVALKAAAVSGTFFTASCTLGKVGEYCFEEKGLVSGRAVGNAIKYGAVALSKGKAAGLDVLLKGAVNGALYGASSAWLGSNHSEYIHKALNIDAATLDISTAPLIEALDAVIGRDNPLIGGAGGVVVAAVVKLYIDRVSNEIDYAIGNATQATTEYFAAEQTEQSNTNEKALITIKQDEIPAQQAVGTQAENDEF